MVRRRRAEVMGILSGMLSGPGRGTKVEMEMMKSFFPLRLGVWQRVGYSPVRANRDHWREARGAAGKALWDTGPDMPSKWECAWEREDAVVMVMFAVVAAAAAAVLLLGLTSSRYRQRQDVQGHESAKMSKGGL